MNTTNTKGALVALHSALERVTDNFRLMLAGKPVRDVGETLAEADAALQAHSPPAPAVASETAAGAVTAEQIRDALESQPWTLEHCKNYPRRASEEIAFLRRALATPPAATQAPIEAAFGNGPALTSTALHALWSRAAPADTSKPGALAWQLGQFARFVQEAATKVPSEPIDERKEFDKIHVRGVGAPSFRIWSKWNEIEKVAAWEAWQARAALRSPAAHGATTSDPLAPLRAWQFKVGNDIFRSLTIKAPNGYSAVTLSTDSNPSNVLRMLAQDAISALNNHPAP